MYIGLKIQNLLKSKDLKQQALAKEMGIGAIHLSKKIGNEAKFSLQQISKAAAFLGVTPQYLRDTTRPFHPGDQIPEDAIAEKPTPIQSTPADLVELARMMERQAADMARSQSERQAQDIEVLKESNAQMAQLLKEVTGNVIALSEIIKDLRDERDGSHDPD